MDHPATLHRRHLLGMIVLVLPGSLAAQDAKAAIRAVEPLVGPLIDGRIAVGVTVGVLSENETAVRGFGRVAKDRAGCPDGDTVYEIGSISKVFTGILLADAVKRGWVTFEDPIRKLVPKGAEVPAVHDLDIRLWHLTTHTSGLPRLPPNFETAQAADPYARYDRRMLLAGLAASKPDRAPGVKFGYSNFAVGLLGQLLVDLHERRTGKAKEWDELVQELICGPVGLVDTRQHLTDGMRKRLAPPYDDAQRPMHGWDFQALAGAGALRSTAHDLLKFARAQLEDAVPVFKAAREARYSPGLGQRLAGEPTVACGWFLQPARGKAWHNGGTGGYRSCLIVDTRNRRAVVVLANSTAAEVDRVAHQVFDVVSGKEPTPIRVRRVVEVPRETLGRYVGRYRLSEAAVFDVRLEDGVLTAQLTGQVTLPLFAATENRFFYRAVRAEIAFELPTEGPATKLTLFQNGRVMPSPRIAAK